MTKNNNIAKIMITYGPILDSSENLEEIIRHTDIIRINMSHGNSEQWGKYVKKIRDISNKIGKNIEMCADLPGPKIRVNNVNGQMDIKKGQKIRFGYNKNIKDVLNLNFDISTFVNKGSYIYTGDEGLKFTVNTVNGGFIECTAMVNGTIVNGRGVDIEDMPDDFAPPTDADLQDINFAVNNNFEYIAISFVASVDNIVKVRASAKNTKIISKIERKCAIERIEGIASASDWIMVARGDLGFTIPIEEVPIAQKIIINACKKTKTPVIVATQMLTSMITTPMPTRAEVSDIANAIIDGANCLMVSNETAVGAYPLEVVMTLERGIKKAEEYMKVINTNA
ncbi:MAG: pyruvate kinase [Candidatus Marsarchaeota archaeon]|nr:pyruvate kinase [Candidatus Marsarchaeota archaeon]